MYSVNVSAPNTLCSNVVYVSLNTSQTCYIIIEFKLLEIEVYSSITSSSYFIPMQLFDKFIKLPFFSFFGINLRSHFLYSLLTIAVTMLYIVRGIVADDVIKSQKNTLASLNLRFAIYFTHRKRRKPN